MSLKNHFNGPHLFNDIITVGTRWGLADIIFKKLDHILGSHGCYNSETLDQISRTHFFVLLLNFHIGK